MKQPVKQHPREEAGGGRGAYLLYGGAIAIIVLLLAGGWFFLTGGSDVPPPKQVREMTVVNIVPPPPPPPPPPKMIEQPKVVEETKMVEQPLEDKPVEKPADDPVKDAKNEEPPGPLALDAKATGPSDLFNLGSKVGGSPYGGRGGGGGSRWGWFASKVQTQITDALGKNEKVKYAVMQLQFRLWADNTGRVTRVELVNSSGNPEVDAAVRSEVGRLTLNEPPPSDMPMPILLRANGRKTT